MQVLGQLMRCLQQLLDEMVTLIIASPKQCCKLQLSVVQGLQSLDTPASLHNLCLVHRSASDASDMPVSAATCTIALDQRAT